MGSLTYPTSGGRPPATRVRYVVMVWLCMAAIIAYIQRNCISVAEENIREDLQLTMEQMGLAMNAFLISYALFQIPAGMLSHKWGTRRALPTFAALWSISTGLTALADGLPMLFLTRFAVGAAQAGVFVCSTLTISKWFGTASRGFPSGLLGSAMSVGGAIAAALTGLLLEIVSWPWVFVLFAVPGLIWALGFYLWFRDNPQDHPAVNDEELALLEPSSTLPTKPGNEPTPWALILTSPAMAWICGQQFFRAAAYFFFTSRFPTFLKMTRHVNTADAGLLTSLPLLGVVFGGFLGGILSDWLLAKTGSRRISRQGLAVASLSVCTLCILLAYFVDDALLAVLIIGAGSLCAAFAGTCAYTITIDMGGKHVAMVFSLMNMSGNVGAMLFPALVPVLVAATGDWDLVLFAFAAVYLAAAVCWAFLNPNRSIFDRTAATTTKELSQHAIRGHAAKLLSVRTGPLRDHAPGGYLSPHVGGGHARPVYRGSSPLDSDGTGFSASTGNAGHGR